MVETCLQNKAKQLQVASQDEEEMLTMKSHMANLDDLDMMVRVWQINY